MEDQKTFLDLDWDLIQHLAIPESVGYLQAEQFTSDLLVDPLSRQVFDWQWEHIREHGKPASGAVLEDQFTDVTLTGIEAAIGDLVGRIRERYMRNEGRKIVKNLAELAVQEPLAVAKEMLRGGRHLADLTLKRGEVFGEGDFHRAMALYDKRALQGRGPSLGFKEVDDHFNGILGVTFLIAAPKTYKALALDTPIPTPEGWTTMGEISIGDVVYDQNGNQCNVVGKSPVWQDRPCYRVEFSDRTSIVADAEHLWETDMRDRGRGVRTTEQIRETLSRSDIGHNHSIPVAGQLVCTSRGLPIDPYVLGIWLGDGTSREAAITTADEEVVSEIQNVGYVVSKWPSAKYAYTVRGLLPELRGLDLLSNKHIPSTYLRSGYYDRVALLQGLMDSDGHCSPRGECVFTTTSTWLRDGVLELVRSLGLKPVANEYRATIGGADHGPMWHVRFVAYKDLPVFRLTRKAKFQKAIPTNRTRSQTRQIVAVIPVASVPVQCITVDSDRHLYLAGEGMVPTHNSWYTINAVNENVQGGQYPYLFSLELPADETYMRLQCLAADLPYWKYLKGCLTPDDRALLRAKADYFSERQARFRIEKPVQGERGVQRMIERALNAGATSIFLDQLQYIENRKGVSIGSANNTGDYFEVVNDLRNYSDEVPIFVVHQFNRSVMGAKEFPEMQQGKGSSAIEEVATLALGLWATKEMRSNNIVQLGTLASRNYSYETWRLGVNLSHGCRFTNEGVVEEDV